MSKIKPGCREMKSGIIRSLVRGEANTSYKLA
jgi:hypothetical protein